MEGIVCTSHCLKRESGVGTVTCKQTFETRALSGYLYLLGPSIRQELLRLHLGLVIVQAHMKQQRSKLRYAQRLMGGPQRDKDPPAGASMPADCGDQS